jgi:hypothetical protein
MNRRDFLAAVTTSAAAVAVEAMPEDTSCDIVRITDVVEECSRPAVWKYAPDVGTRMLFCHEHARMCATMPLVPVHRRLGDDNVTTDPFQLRDAV